jgi:cytochrome c oxidase subunit III
MYLVAATIILALVFLINKYFEWGSKFEHGMYPGSDLMALAEQRRYAVLQPLLFYDRFHAVHIIVGMILLIVTFSG